MGVTEFKPLARFKHSPYAVQRRALPLFIKIPDLRDVSTGPGTVPVQPRPLCRAAQETASGRSFRGVSHHLPALTTPSCRPARAGGET